MNLEQLMKERNGLWENGFAIVQDAGGYYWRVAEGSPDKFNLLKDAAKFGLVDNKVANTLADVVDSAQKPTRERKRPKAPTVDDLDLDV